MPPIEGSNPPDGARAIQYAVLQFARPSDEIVNIGVLVIDPFQDELYIRMRDDWSGFDDSAMEILETLADDLRNKADELGPSTLLLYLEDTLSNSLRISGRYDLGRDCPIDTDLLERLFRQHGCCEE